jgi:hypothetical protein
MSSSLYSIERTATNRRNWQPALPTSRATLKNAAGCSATCISDP